MPCGVALLRPCDHDLTIGSTHTNGTGPVRSQLAKNRHPRPVGSHDTVTPAQGSVRKHLCCALIEEEAGEFGAAVNANDLVEIADALADLLWVVILGGLTFGIPLGEVFAEVLRSNWSKADASGRVERDPNGKIRKGPHFSPPDLSPILERHAEHSAEAPEPR